MKTRIVILMSSVLGACVPQQGWQPRTCVERGFPTDTAYFSSTADNVFRDLRLAVSQAGYELSSHDGRGGYLKGSLRRDMCRAPVGWEGTRPDGSEYNCDPSWPVLRRATVEIFVDVVTSSSSRARIQITDRYEFENAQSTTDVCPEDYSNLFREVEL